MPASRSLIALLIGTVVFFALWMFALKPHSSSNGGSGSSSSQGVGAFKSDINKAHQAVATSNASNAASGNENAVPATGGAAASKPTVTPTHTTSSSSSKPSTATAKSSTKSPANTTTKAAIKPSAATAAAKRHALAANLSTVQGAVHAHKVLALLFYNPLAADDQAVKNELASVPTRKGQVVKLAIPLDEAANLTAVTQQVPVNLSPTLVLISRAGNATEIVGYSDSFEIKQRVDSALSASTSSAS